MMSSDRDKHKTEYDTGIAGYIAAAALLVILTVIPVATLGRMAVGHIPVTQYRENILGKYKMITLNTALSEKISGGMYMESNEVLLGKDGWLFYKTDTDGEPLYDYMGINRFTDEELMRIHGNLSEVSETVYSKRVELRAKKGRPVFLPERDAVENSVSLAVLTIPNKEQVYSEYMPDTVEKIYDTSRLKQLSGYMDDRGHETVVMDRYVPIMTYTDVSDVFTEVHDDYPLYYKTDTHWTDVGAYLALTQVMDGISERRPVIRLSSDEDDREDKSPASVLDEVTFTEESGFVGDLTKISATQDRFTDVTYKIDGDSIPDRYRTNSKLLIVGDSFGDAMQHVAVYCYKEVRFMDIKEYRDRFEDELTEYQPDLVILECVERYLPRLTALNE